MFVYRSLIFKWVNSRSCCNCEKAGKLVLSSSSRRVSKSPGVARCLFTAEDVSPPAQASCSLCTTAHGWLQRVVVLGTETHVIEEIQLFEAAQPVDSLTISHSKVRREWEGSRDVTSAAWNPRSPRESTLLRRWDLNWGWESGRCGCLGACFHSFDGGAEQPSPEATPTIHVENICEKMNALVERSRCCLVFPPCALGFCCSAVFSSDEQL